MAKLNKLPSRVKGIGPAVKTLHTPMGVEVKRTRGSRWMRIRTRILSRDKGLCQECIRHGHIRLADHIDHIIPLHAGGTDDDSNLEAICIDCHKQKTADELREARNVGDRNRNGRGR